MVAAAPLAKVDACVHVGSISFGKAQACSTSAKTITMETALLTRIIIISRHEAKGLSATYRSASLILLVDRLPSVSAYTPEYFEKPYSKY